MSFVSISTCLFAPVYIYIHLPVCIYICLSDCLYLHLSIHPSLRISIILQYLSIYHLIISNYISIYHLTISMILRYPLSKNCTYPEWAKGLAKSLWTPHIQHTPSLNCYRLADATELWAPERPDTETVSSLRQSISRTLDIKRGTHKHYLHYLFITHFLISILHISDLYTHNCLS